MQKLIYPSYLASDEYKMRTITFYAMTHDISHENPDKEIFKSSSEYVDTSGSTTASTSGEEEDAGGIIEDAFNALTPGGNRKFKTESCIVLPLPNNLTDNQDHSWENMESMVSTIAKPFLNANVGGSIAKSVTSKVGQILGGTFSTLANSPLGKALSKMGDGISKSLNDLSINNSVAWMSHSVGVRKPLIDPGYFQNYTGSTPRMFNMIFEFMPENGAEAEIIRQIILAFKKMSSPSIGINGYTLLAPFYWQVNFGNPFISQMVKLDCVVISNISIDYSGDSNMQQFADGFPKHITMTITMKEARLTYADNYDSNFDQNVVSDGVSDSDAMAWLQENSTNSEKIEVKNKQTS